MGTPKTRTTGMLALLSTALLAGCASISTTLSPPQQAPVCDPGAAALILWTPQWRANQKDVAEREAAAQAGLERFVAHSSCFARTALRRVASLSPSNVSEQLAVDSQPFTRLVTIEVHELGPIIKLLASPALLEGGTEVVLRVSTDFVPQTAQARVFTVHWQHGGPGVIKGVATLPEDMAAALQAGLQAKSADR